MRSIVAAIVKVLPVPVAPSSVWNRLSEPRPSANPSIALGWSAVGVYAGFSLNLGTDSNLAAP